MNNKHFNFIIFNILIIIIKAYKPIIGVYGNSYPQNDYKYHNGSYIPGSYIYYLESFGAKLVAIHQWYSHNEIDKLLNQINGILFLGGDRDLLINEYWEKTANYILKKSIELKIPLFGICQGFQIINILLAQEQNVLIKGYKDFGILHNSTIIGYYKNHKMFSLFETEDIDKYINKNGSVFFHSLGVPIDLFEKNEYLKKYLKITSISEDNNKKPFINTIEGINDDINIFAIQNHPEKIVYMRTHNYTSLHTNDALKVSDLFGLFIVEQARKNKNRFNENLKDKYDFFNTYENKTKYYFYDYETNSFYFKKRENEIKINDL